MQTGWLVVVAVTFGFALGLGFLLGYFVRALISHRRRRAARRMRYGTAGQESQQLALQLQRPRSCEEDIMSGTSPTALHCAPDAPGLVGLPEEDGHPSGRSNPVGFVGPDAVDAPRRQR